jgi:predicted transcriptional regulator
MNNPIRRKILKILNDGDMTMEELEYKTGLDKDSLKWHVNVLENGFCIEKEKHSDNYLIKITQEGKVVNYIE